MRVVGVVPGRQNKANLPGRASGGHCPPYKARRVNCWIEQGRAPGLRLLRRRAPRNDVRAVGTRNLGLPGRAGKELCRTKPIRESRDWLQMPWTEEVMRDFDSEAGLQNKANFASPRWACGRTSQRRVSVPARLNKPCRHDVRRRFLAQRPTANGGMPVHRQTGWLRFSFIHRRAAATLGAFGFGR
jgi:hypothetical protein